MLTVTPSGYKFYQVPRLNHVADEAGGESHHFSRATILLTRFVPEESFISIVKRLNISTNPRKSVLA